MPTESCLPQNWRDGSRALPGLCYSRLVVGGRLIDFRWSTAFEVTACCDRTHDSQPKGFLDRADLHFFRLKRDLIARDYSMGTAIKMGPAYFPTILGGLLLPSA